MTRAVASVRRYYSAGPRPTKRISAISANAPPPCTDRILVMESLGAVQDPREPPVDRFDENRLVAIILLYIDRKPRVPARRKHPFFRERCIISIYFLLFLRFRVKRRTRMVFATRYNDSFFKPLDAFSGSGLRPKVTRSSLLSILLKIRIFFFFLRLSHIAFLDVLRPFISYTRILDHLKENLENRWT